MPPNNWYVITGGPSTGKTTLLAELSRLGYATVPEAARTVIDEALVRGRSVEDLRSDEKEFQAMVAQLKERVHKSLDPTTTTFFDRGMQDTTAYLKYYDFEIDDWINQLMTKSRYKKVFLLEPLAEYQKDYARTEDKQFNSSIGDLLEAAYTEYGMQPILVPPKSVQERVDYIMKHINEEHTT